MLDLRAFELEPGGVRRETVPLRLDALRLGGQRYDVLPKEIPAVLELQPGQGGLFLKLAFEAVVRGPCMRCLEDAELPVSVRAQEYHDAAADPDDEELRSDYLDDMQLDVERWARDALVERVPDKIVCRPDCAGLCSHCGARLEPGVEHSCGEPETDSRWDRLRELL
jgi:uncharacterized protein